MLTAELILLWLCYPPGTHYSLNALSSAQVNGPHSSLLKNCPDQYTVRAEKVKNRPSALAVAILYAKCEDKNTLCHLIGSEFTFLFDTKARVQDGINTPGWFHSFLLHLQCGLNIIKSHIFHRQTIFNKWKSRRTRSIHSGLITFENSTSLQLSTPSASNPEVWADPFHRVNSEN